MSARAMGTTLSHCPIPYSVGQWDKTPNSGTNRGTGNEAVSLKALAAKVLRAVPHGTNGGTDSGTGGKTVGQDADFSAPLVPLSQASDMVPADTRRTRLRAREEAAPVPADDSPLAALAKFEKNPHGVIHWLAQQQEGQPAHMVLRWAACIQAEARLRLAEAEAGEVVR